MNVQVANRNLSRLNRSRIHDKIVDTLTKYKFKPMSVPDKVIENLKKRTALENVIFIVHILNIMATLFAIQMFLSSSTFIKLGDTDVKINIVKMIAKYLLRVISLVKEILKIRAMKPFIGTIMAVIPLYNATLLKQAVTNPVETSQVIFDGIFKKGGTKKALKSLLTLRQNKDKAAVFSALLIGGLSNYMGASKIIKSYINMTEEKFTDLNRTNINTLKKMYTGATYAFGMTQFRDLIDTNITILVRLLLSIAVHNIYRSVHSAKVIMTKTGRIENKRSPTLKLENVNKTNRKCLTWK